MLKKNSPFTNFQDVYPGKEDWDKYYIDYEVQDYVEKTGEGDTEFVVKKRVIEHKRDIVEEINAQADEVGVYNLIKRVALTGDDTLMPKPLDNNGVVSDYTNVPDNLLDADNMAKRAEQAYNNLPDELKKGRSFAEFCDNVTQDELKAFFASMQPEEKKEGDL